MTHRKKMILLAIVVGLLWIGSVGLRIYDNHALHDIAPDVQARIDETTEISYRIHTLGEDPEYILSTGVDHTAIVELVTWLEGLQGSKTTDPNKRESLWDADIRMTDVVYLLKNGGLLMSIEFYEDGTIGVVDMVIKTAKYYKPAEAVKAEAAAAFFPEVPTRAKLNYYTDVWRIQDAAITCNWTSHEYSGQSASTTAVSDFRTWMDKRTVRPSDTPPGNAETDDHYYFKLYGQAGREPEKSRTWEIFLFEDGVTIDGTDHYVWADNGSVEEDLEELLLRFAYGWHPTNAIQQ